MHIFIAAGGAARARAIEEAANASTALQAMITGTEDHELREMILDFVREDEKEIPEGFREATNLGRSRYYNYQGSVVDRKLLVSFPVIKKEKEKIDVGFFRKKFVEGKEIAVQDYEYISLAEALKRTLPEGAVVINIVVDWYNRFFRVYYMKK